MENTVETNMEQQAVQDDAVLEPLQEQEEQSISSLDEITDRAEEQQQDNERQANQQPPASEPGWMKKKMEAYASKALQEQETRLRSEFRAELNSMLAPLRESMYERQADDLVASGQIKSKEMALKYVKAMAGITSSEPDQTPQAQPRTPDGRFASNQQTEPDAETKARASILAAQADKIKANKGLDVVAYYNANPDVQEKVLSGEWDFYDVADAMNQPRRRVPSPVRSSNSAMGATADASAIANMSDAQFERLLKNLGEGKVYDMR